MPNDLCTTGSLETRKSITSLQLNLPSGRPKSWAWGLNLDPRLNLPLQLSLIYRLKTSVVEFAFKLCSLISHRILISILHCTFPPAGILCDRTSYSKTSSFICTRHCEGTFLNRNRTGRTILPLEFFQLTRTSARHSCLLTG